MNNFILKFDRLQRALAELSPARRLLAGTLVAVMLATGVWAISRVASSSSPSELAGGAMEPVLDQTFPEADIARIVKHLDAKGVEHKIENGKVLVAASERLDVLSDLFYAGILGGGNGKSSGFDAMVKQMTAWDPPSKTDKMFNRYREEKVEEVIGRYPGVRKTTVVIDPTNERHLGGESIVPTAMVDIQTRGEGAANPRQLSQAAVNVLTGVIANLSRDRVRVTIDGATFNSSDALAAGSVSSGELSERKQKAEQLHVAKVRQLLSYIPGDVLVSVSVDLDVPAGADDVDQSAKPQADNAEVVANAVPVIPDATKTTPPLRTESVRSASVAVPRTYFVKIYRRANSGTQEPTDALLQPVVDAYSLKIRNLVKNALGLDHDDAVTVEQYDDALPSAVDAAVAASSTVAPSAAAATAGTAAPPVAAITRNLNAYAREIAFVTLGAVIVTALSLIVRRRNPRPVMVDAHGRQHVGGDPEIINGTLNDVADDDMSDDDRGYGGDPHQLFRRVRDMAQDHPDDAARVLRSWIYQQD